MIGTVPIPVETVLTVLGQGSSHCNGSIASTIGGSVVGACLCDCLHADDLAAPIVAAGLDKRPTGM